MQFSAPHVDIRFEKLHPPRRRAVTRHRAAATDVESRFPLQNPDANFKRFTNLQIELGTRKTARTLRWVFGLG